MKLFTYAIASIVDANTGHGLDRHGKFIDYAAAERLGRDIRAHSISDSLAALRDGLARRIENYRQRMQERREVDKLLNLDDRLLADIGIDRGDLIAVKLGTITLQQLRSNRQRSRGDAIVETADSNAGTLTAAEAANEGTYAVQKCA